jgi:triacylglycerol lipase
MPFDRRLATLTVELSAAAYRDRLGAQAATEALGLTGFHWFSAQSTQAFTATDADHLYVAFRGTEANPIDWSRNARFKPTASEFGRIHSGFGSGVEEVWQGILDAIVGSGKPIVFTGHSLGGALAILGAFRADRASHTVAAVYTYGQPRVGYRDFSRAFSERLKDRTYRAINHVDLVTRVPLLLQGYRHVGSRVYFDRGGVAHLGTNAWRVALDDITYRVTHWGRIKEVAALSLHDIGAYRGRIGGLPL